MARPRAGRGAPAPPVLVEVLRGGHVESRHRGSIAVVAPTGELLSSLGDVEAPVFIRSSAKPFQLAPFVASGLFDSYGLGDEALAIMAASHSGEDRHVRTVQGILRGVGLTQAVLQCGPQVPYDVETARRLARDGEPPSAIRHNCSGKHAGMVLFARALGAPIDTYWQPDHPVQAAALSAVAAFSGVAQEKILTATDGCGVVTFGIPLRALALAYARLADPSGLADPSLRDAATRIRDAMMAHPELVGGERRRLDTALMRAEPGRILSKGGAEGVAAVGLPAGDATAARGVAIKVEDGDSSSRARNVATCAALAQLGALPPAALAALEEFAAPAIRDPRGERSGEVRASFSLSA